ncbi:hypothetical protein LAUMK13_03175 [Mycobacterium innocens]|uniref:Uncharacterized protein n=1 Tax=Mycobacterium innocens TaxID=2341083 RepID=A0A498Q6S3_9MYCO|nr:hypothetical protein LAUMK13_03175 [Mycobacterium innocens]
MIVDAGVKSDMRGLVTAGRTVLLERIAGSSQIDHGVARFGVKMGWWSPCDAVALWSLQAVV